MNNFYSGLFHTIDWNLFFLASFLFFAGVLAAIPVVKKDITFLLLYPLWVWKKLKEILEKNNSFLKLFFLIFVFNSLSLFTNFLSGFGIILPYLLLLFTGLNVGIIGYKEGKLKALFVMFLSPHAFFELPALWMSAMLGMKIGANLVSSATEIFDLFGLGLLFFGGIIIPLLLIAALIESALIRISIISLKQSPPLPAEPLQTQEQNHSNEQ
ncbi:hypothetical protein B6I21_01850 [candidate division KSB1 bacterium 4572_119]|nr:MAG: hypothetical protein B6I21_01850 [candidate division KSB1 bacterium 4572_119]